MTKACRGLFHVVERCGGGDFKGEAIVEFTEYKQIQRVEEKVVSGLENIQIPVNSQGGKILGTILKVAVCCQLRRGEWEDEFRARVHLKLSTPPDPCC